MDDFLKGLTGYIILPFDPLYNKARQGFNRAKQKYPLVIVYCKSILDVSNAVKWAEKHGISIRVRSGGHNYEGYSNGDCKLVIDLSKMKEMNINRSKNQLCVQGGVTNNDVYNFISSKGYPFPGGTCPTVGVSGYVLGGGWGLSCRKLGLGCDSLEELKIVNYKGCIITASRRKNPDLFWACKGAGGGNFGVVVAMTFKLPKKVNKVTLIEIDYLNVNSNDQKRLLYTWQEWLKTADSRTTLISRIYKSKNDGLSMLVRGIFYGKPEEAKELLRKFLKINCANYRFEYITFLEAVKIIGSSYPYSEKFESSSRFVLRYFNNNEISKVVNLIKNPPKGSVFTGISMYALGGKVSQVGVNETAFFYRKANYIIWLETIWEDEKFERDNILWIKKQFPYLKSITKGSYVNFPYAGLANYLKDYYGSHVYRLKDIKAKYDPFNIFTFPQGINKEKFNHISSNMNVSLLPEEIRENAEKGLDDVSYRGFRYVSKK